jgi:hypothetical protein
MGEKVKKKRNALSVILKNKKLNQNYEGYFLALKQTIDKPMREIFSPTIKAKRPSYISDPFKSQLNNIQIPIIKIINRKKSIRDKFSLCIKSGRPNYITDPYKSQLDHRY